MPPRCMMCLPRAVSVSLRIVEHQASDRWRRNLCKANVTDAPAKPRSERAAGNYLQARSNGKGRKRALEDAQQ
nr:unnamed protein product [Haemonchus contortus]